jgi:hypothetical protein
MRLLLRKMTSFVFALVLMTGCNTKHYFTKNIEEYNYIIGTQTVGAKYKFTDETNLVETARAIRGMGSNLLKMSMSPRYFWENYDILYDENIRSLTDLAKEESMSKVLNMDFKYYQIWVYEFSQYTQEPKGEKRDEYQIKFIDGLNDNYAEKSYKEIYDLACYLLKKYSGTGKIFFLGNWEGDWHLRWDYDRNKSANPKTIEGMIRWINVRQKAVDDAKRDTPHRNVEMYHYLEVNLSDLALRGENCVINNVLPETTPDYISFSSYSAINPHDTWQHMDSVLTKHLNYIESKIKPKEGIKGKRLFIGEYGWSEAQYTQSQINERAKWVIKSSIKWGCPFVLFWEMYNNELNENGANRGFWLIDKQQRKTLLYHTHQNFYNEAKEWVSSFANKNKRMPTQEEFARAALKFNSLN